MLEDIAPSRVLLRRVRCIKQAFLFDVGPQLQLEIDHGKIPDFEIAAWLNRMG
jgi:hypothetical protein